MLEGHQLATTAKYTAVTITPTRASIESEFSMSGQVRADDAPLVLNMEGGGKGTIAWEAGRYLPPGSSATMFLRMVEMEGAQRDKPGKTACVLIAMETK